MYFKLLLLFKDGRREEHIIKRFSDLAQDKCDLYYYEEPHNEHGKGTCIKRSEIDCFEIVLNNGG